MLVLVHWIEGREESEEGMVPDQKGHTEKIPQIMTIVNFVQFCLMALCS